MSIGAAPKQIWPSGGASDAVPADSHRLRASPSRERAHRRFRLAPAVECRQLLFFGRRRTCPNDPPSLWWPQSLPQSRLLAGLLRPSYASERSALSLISWVSTQSRLSVGWRAGEFVDAFGYFGFRRDLDGSLEFDGELIGQRTTSVLSCTFWRPMELGQPTQTHCG